jgi:hypothetical protein
MYATTEEGNESVFAFGRELVLHYELCEVAHYLGRGRHLDYVTEQQIGLRVRQLHILELRAQTETERLELQVGVLTAR